MIFIKREIQRLSALAKLSDTVQFGQNDFPEGRVAPANHRMILGCDMRIIAFLLVLIVFFSCFQNRKGDARFFDEQIAQLELSK